MNFIASLEPHVVMYILSSISEGLTALGKAAALVRFVCVCVFLCACVCVEVTSLCLCVCFRYDGVHRLLLQPRPHRHLPVQAAVALHQEAARSHGDR